MGGFVYSGWLLVKLEFLGGFMPNPNKKSTFTITKKKKKKVPERLLKICFLKKVESKKGLEKSARQKDNNAEDWMMKLLETRADKFTMQHATRQ